MAGIFCRLTFVWLVVLSLFEPTDATAQLAGNCGSIENAYGPYDYTNPVHFKEKLPIVESGHFDAGVEGLTGHMDKAGALGMLGGDIDYTLRAFPNHHRALYAMIRYYDDKVSRGASPMRYSAECYFERAIRMAPTDGTVVLLQGIYFMKVGRSQDARTSFEVALELAPGSAEIHYNAGLGYVDLKEYDLAVQHAHRAYELGYPLMGLKNKLKRLGVWEDSRLVAD